MVDELRCRACGVKLTVDQAYCGQCGTSTGRGTSPAAEAFATGRPEWQSPRRPPVDDPEIELWRGTYSWKGMFREFLLACGLTIAGCYLLATTDGAHRWSGTIPAIAMIWLFLAAWLGLRKWSTSYTLTTQRLIHEKGILYRRTRRIEAIDIDDLGYEQGIIERLLDVGRIHVDSADVSDRSLTLVAIDRPRQVYELLERARRDERLRYGLHIEAV